MFPRFEFITNGLRNLANPDKGARFWLAQILMLASTVIGVYLAGMIGFEKGMQFDELRSQKVVYHMLSSIEGELDDNLNAMQKLTGELKTLPFPIMQRLRQERGLDTFIWESMKESSETFRIPSDIITAIRRYYSNMEGIMRRLEKSELGRNHAADQIKSESAKVKELVMIRIHEEKQRIEDTLASNNMTVNGTP
jgi:hypothetical protein